MTKRPLTDAELTDIFDGMPEGCYMRQQGHREYARAVIAAHEAPRQMTLTEAWSIFGADYVGDPGRTLQALAIVLRDKGTKHPRLLALAATVEEARECRKG